MAKKARGARKKAGRGKTRRVRISAKAAKSAADRALKTATSIRPKFPPKSEERKILDTFIENVDEAVTLLAQACPKGNPMFRIFRVRP